MNIRCSFAFNDRLCRSFFYVQKTVCTLLFKLKLKHKIMKLKSIKKRIWSIVIIITTLIGILPAQANTTETPVKDVELDGRWDDPIRSAATNCPITVFTDGYLLTLKNASPDRDMTIRITDMAKGGVVYENDIPEVQSAYITISIANFPAEEYKLEITGTPSGHLTGYFTQE